MLSVGQRPSVEEQRSANRVFIVGAGGFGREVYGWFGRSALLARLVGFLSADLGALDGLPMGHRVVGSPDDHDVRPGDAFVLAIGIPGVRRNVAEALQSRGASFLTLIHHTAMVAESATIHQGAIICPYAVVSTHARVGACVILNYHSSAAHDAVIGDYTVLSPYAAVGGNAVLEDDVFVGLHGTVGPGKRVGARSKVAASSCALLNVPPDCLALGVPARITPLLYR